MTTYLPPPITSTDLKLKKKKKSVQPQEYHLEILASFLEQLKTRSESSNVDTFNIRKLVRNSTNFLTDFHTKPSPTSMGSVPEILISLLGDSSRDETIINAAGVIATVAATAEGRHWLLDSVSNQNRLIRFLYRLLGSTNQWIASNAALIVARLSISEEGSTMLLQSQIRDPLIQRLINHLGPSKSGVGMNSAFAIGRLVESPEGRESIFENCDLDNLTIGLSNMLSEGTYKGRKRREGKPGQNVSYTDMSICKNACFCLTSLAECIQGNLWLARNSLMLYGSPEEEWTLETAKLAGLPGQQAPVEVVGIIRSFLLLLKSTDEELIWFTVVALRSFATYAHGYRVLRLNTHVWETVKNLPAFVNNTNLLEEVNTLRSLLSPLETPPMPRVARMGKSSVIVVWPPCNKTIPLTIFYEIYLQTETTSACQVFRGTQCTAEVEGLKPGKNYFIKMRLSTEIDASDFSNVLQTRAISERPASPKGLRATTVTTSQVKLQWESPEAGDTSIKSYHVSVNGKEVRITPQTTAILSGLLPMVEYDIAVVASNGVKKSAPAELQVVTASSARHGPSKPTVLPIGQSEVLVSWEPPEVPLGRISRYEVYVTTGNLQVQKNNTMEQNPSWSGLDTSCRIKGLQSGTKYIFKVVMIGSSGKFRSELTNARTGRNEYSNPPRTLLYEPKRIHEVGRKLETPKPKTSLVNAPSRRPVKVASRNTNGSSISFFMDPINHLALSPRKRIRSKVFYKQRKISEENVDLHEDTSWNINPPSDITLDTISSSNIFEHLNSDIRPKPCKGSAESRRNFFMRDAATGESLSIANLDDNGNSEDPLSYDCCVVETSSLLQPIQQRNTILSSRTTSSGQKKKESSSSVQQERQEKLSKWSSRSSTITNKTKTASRKIHSAATVANLRSGISLFEERYLRNQLRASYRMASAGYGVNEFAAQPPSVIGSLAVLDNDFPGHSEPLPYFPGPSNLWKSVTGNQIKSTLISVNNNTREGLTSNM